VAFDLYCGIDLWGISDPGGCRWNQTTVQKEVSGRIKRKTGLWQTAKTCLSFLLAILVFGQYNYYE
jgi:hypothetical protein